ncbi:unnamed protein product, partial [Staurois parvus]
MGPPTDPGPSAVPEFPNGQSAPARHMRLGIVVHQKEPRTHCTSVGSDNGSKDFILISN